ncbi:lysoplasmalogenase family protein [Clostridium chromiireducens]|uniref:YhhN-like protein n=1 Tax=Clostridium chromiireducens TaxID=225345 RepID=A0A1V4IF83_9CLOT|nr:lysoplasmalogenase family protein [Clostridium chromiireducens]OPJ58510.1 YhhN-like protein [Clostridium chromiireducens]
MNNAQRILMAIYFPITILILIFDNIYPKENMVLYLKYAIMVTLFLSAITIKKKFFEQKLMALSFFFLVIADFFLVFAYTIQNLKIDLSPFGILGFLCAYLCLIVAYQKEFKLGKAEILIAILFIIIFIVVFCILIPYINNVVMKAGILIFGAVLSYMTWTSVCTIFRNYFTKKASWIIAVSGSLMFICDVGVAFSIFYPPFVMQHTPWLTNIIWIAYIPGWTLLAVLICEKDLLY